MQKYTKLRGFVSRATDTIAIKAKLRWTWGRAVFAPTQRTFEVKHLRSERRRTAAAVYRVSCLSI